MTSAAEMIALFHELDNLCHSEERLSNLFHGTGSYSHQSSSSFEGDVSTVDGVLLCLSRAIDFFLEEGNLLLEIEETATIAFLISSVPLLTELFLRRKNARYISLQCLK